MGIKILTFVNPEAPMPGKRLGIAKNLKNSEMQMARQTTLRGKQFIKTLQDKLLRQFIQPSKMFY